MGEPVAGVHFTVPFTWSPSPAGNDDCFGALTPYIDNALPVLPVPVPSLKTRARQKRRRRKVLDADGTTTTVARKSQRRLREEAFGTTQRGFSSSESTGSTSSGASSSQEEMSLWELAAANSIQLEATELPTTDPMLAETLKELISLVSLVEEDEPMSPAQLPTRSSTSIYAKASKGDRPGALCARPAKGVAADILREVMGEAVEDILRDAVLEVAFQEVMEELFEEASWDIVEEVVEESVEEVVMRISVEEVIQGLVGEAVDDVVTEAVDESSQKVSLRSSDGVVLRPHIAVASVSPVIAELCQLGHADGEMPLLQVRSTVLSDILKLCEGYVCKRRWDVSVSSDIARSEEVLEELAHAADRLRLEQLSALCLGTLAHRVKEKGPEHTCASVASMRWALQDWMVCTSVELIMALLDGLAAHAARGDLQSVEAVLLYIDSFSPVVREAAIRAVARLAPIDDAALIAHLQRSVCDHEVQVQVAALAAIAEVAAPGNQEALAVVKEKCLDGVAAVRCAAVEGVGRIAVRQDTHAITVARQGLEDASASVRKAAVEALGQLFKKGDEQAALNLIKLHEDMDESVRQAASHAVALIAEKDHEAARNALLMQLEHRYFWVSAAAFRALKEMDVGEGSVIDAILARLGHQDASTRLGALEALTRIASKADAHVLEGLLSYLKHRDEGVREAAVKALAKVGKGEEMVIKAVGNLLQQPRHSLRKTALKTLKVIANKGDERAIVEVCSLLKHGSSEVRLDALSAIPHVANRNDHLAIEGICHNMLDQDTSLQKAAALSFDKNVDKGNEQAIGFVIGQLDVGSDSHILQTTVRLLPSIAGCSDESVQLVSSVLQRQSLKVRSAIFDASMQAVDPNYRQCVFAVCSCWESDAPGAGRSAEGQVSDPTRQLQCAGVRIAAEALSVCLLRPSVRLPDAILGALKAADVCGDPVAASVKTCMSQRRWFIRWETIEFMCGNALAARNGEPSLMKSGAKMERRSSVRDKSASDNRACLHRPGCPCDGDRGKPAKRAKLARAGA